MIGKHLRRACVLSALGAFLLLGVGDRALAVKDPVTIPGTIWNTTGVAKVAGAGMGSEVDVIDALVGFGPVPGLDPEEFGMILDPGGASIGIQGTFEELKPGKPVIVVDQTALESELEGLLLIDLTMRNTTVKVKPKSKDGVDTIRVFLNSHFRGCFTDDRGRPVCKNFTLQYKGEGGLAP